jgi:MATE family multidrug resistance protein
MLGEMGWMSTYIVDALMIGRLPHSALSISASSLGNTIFYAIAFCAIGLLTGLQTLTAQAYGRGNEQDGALTVAQACLMVAVLTPLVMLATLASIPLLSVFKTPPDIIAETSRYLHALVWSTAPLLLYWGLRKYLQSVDRVILITVSLVSSSFVNFVADWAFLYGHLGLPKFGIAGSGWATVVVRFFALALLLVALGRYFRISAIRFSRSLLRPNWDRLRVLLHLGWPPALESLADLSVSTFTSILCAQLGATLLAAHQVVLDLNAFVYMVPLGLSYATTARVGQGAGRNSVRQARRSAQASLMLGLGLIAIAAPLFAGLPRFWAGLYTNDAAVVTAAAPIFLLCGILQFGDAAGAILAAALVGVGDTRTPLIVNTIWSWVLGMPLSYWLTFDNGLGLKGLWIGRVLASIGASITLALIWQQRIRSMNLSNPSSGRGTYSFGIQPPLAEPG